MAHLRPARRRPSLPRTSDRPAVAMPAVLGGVVSSLLAAGAVLAVVLALLVSFGKSAGEIEAAQPRPAAQVEQPPGGVGAADADEDEDEDAADEDGADAAAGADEPADSDPLGAGPAAESGDLAGAGPDGAETGSSIADGESDDAAGAEERRSPDDAADDAASASDDTASASGDGAGRAPVVVFNQTVRRGLAGDFRDELVAAGWEVSAVDDWRGTVPSTTIYYPSGMEAQARSLMAQFPAVDRIRPAFPGIPTDQLTVILCKEYPEI